MQRFILTAFCLLTTAFTVLIPVQAQDIYKDVEFPKIIYQCPNTTYAPDYNFIDEAGFNVILADYLNGCNVLNIANNTAAIPVTLRGWHPNSLPEIDKYVHSKVIRRNIIEDENYRIGGDQDYPGWSPRIGVQGDRLEQQGLFNMPDSIKGEKERDETFSEPSLYHDVIKYSHTAGNSGEYIFTTNDGNPNPPGGGTYQYLYHHSTFLQGESARPAIIRLKVKIIGAGNPPAQIDPELPILTLKLFYYGKNDFDGNFYFTDPLPAQIVTLRSNDIMNYYDYMDDYMNVEYDEDDYNWACFNVNSSGMPIFLPVLIHGSLPYTHNGIQTYGDFTGLLPNISVCSPLNVPDDAPYTVYIDSMEVWEQDAYNLLLSPDKSIYESEIENELNTIKSYDGSGLIRGFELDDLWWMYFPTSACLDRLVDDVFSDAGIVVGSRGEVRYSPQQPFTDWLMAEGENPYYPGIGLPPENNDYRTLGPKGWANPLEDYQALNEEENAANTPDYQTAYFYPFKINTENPNEYPQACLDRLIGSYDQSSHTGSGLRGLYKHTRDAYTTAKDVKPIMHLGCFQERYTSATDREPDRPIGAVRYRFPTKGELWAESYLSLAYGMRGLGYFCFNTSHYNANDEQYTGTPLLGAQYPNVDLSSPKMMGLFHNKDVANFVKIDESNGLNYCPAEALQEFFADLDIITPCLNNFNWQAGGCYNSYSSQPIIGPVQAIAWMDSKTTDKFIEVTSFEVIDANAIPPGEYFMVVNRDVEDSREIFIALDEIEPYFVEDMATHDIYDITEGIPGMGEGISVSIDAGKGRLLRLINDYTWQGEVRISGDFTVPAGKTLTIATGCTVRVYDGGSIIIPNSRNLICDGSVGHEIVFLPGYHNKSATTANLPWGGIIVQNGIEDTHFDYCHFINADPALEFDNVSASSLIYPVENSIFFDCNIGIKFGEGCSNLKVYNCEFHNSDQIAIEFNNVHPSSTETFVENSDFYNCNIGVKFDEGCSNLRLYNCEIHNSTEAGILFNNVHPLSTETPVEHLDFHGCNVGIRFTQGCENLRINDCYFIDCTQSGVEIASEGSSSDDIEIANSHFVKTPAGGSFYGIEFVNSSGKITQTLFEELSTSNVKLTNCNSKQIDINDCSFVRQTYYNTAAIAASDNCTNNSITIIGKHPDPNINFTINNYGTGIYSTNNELNLIDVMIGKILYGIWSVSDYLDVNNLYLYDDLQNWGDGYSIYATNSDVELDNCDISTYDNGICFDQGSITELVMYNSSVRSLSNFADTKGIEIRDGTSVAINGCGSTGSTVDGFDFGISLNNVSFVNFDNWGLNNVCIQNCGHIGLELNDCLVANIRDATIQSCGTNGETSCGLHCYGTSPIIHNTLFVNNIGPGILADNSSQVELGMADSYDHFNVMDNQYNSLLPAQIYERGRSFTRSNTRHNDFFELPTNGYYIWNEDQESLVIQRKIELNWWEPGTEPDYSRFFPYHPGEPYLYFDADPWDTQSNSGIGGSLAFGGGGLLNSNSYDTGLSYELDGNYASAVTEYQDFIEESDDPAQKSAAMQRVYIASVAGNLPLAPLIGYYQSLSAGPANSVHPLIEDAALRLKAKVRQKMGNFNAAIVAYEQILQSNPSYVDSVYCVIDAGNAYLLRNAFGQAITSSVGPNSIPQMPELEPDSIEAYILLKQELLNSLAYSTISGGNSQTISALPQSFKLHQNSPNPFNPETVIRYDLPELSNVRLEIFNILGQKVCTLVDGWENAGFKEVTWNGQNNQDGGVSSGLYIYKISAEGKNSGKKFVKSQKMMLVQ